MSNGLDSNMEYCLWAHDWVWKDKLDDKCDFKGALDAYAFALIIYDELIAEGWNVNFIERSRRATIKYIDNVSLRLIEMGEQP